MKPLFTIHAGEYLVGSLIEETYKDYDVWIPSKDTGIDLLVTSQNNSLTASIQVKFSKDFLTTHGRKEYQDKLIAMGWWVLNRDKLRTSPADFWVLVIHSFNVKNTQYVVIDPKELYSRMQKLHPKVKSLQTYLWVTSSQKCWETRGLKKNDQNSIVKGTYSNNDRDFSEYLNNWNAVEKKLQLFKSNSINDR